MKQREVVYKSTVAYGVIFQVDILERDALQVLSLIRSVKNTFTLVNRTPPEILSSIPDYWEGGGRDEGLIGLTHVCRLWRELFVSRSSLWARLDCRSIEKTRVYIERSKTSPLEIVLNGLGPQGYHEEAFLLTVAHVGRVKTLSVLDSEALLQVLAKHFSSPAPFLEKLEVKLLCDPTLTLPGTLFNGDPSSLRELSLAGLLMPTSWRGLGNLTTFSLSGIPSHGIILAHLLDFFESAPRLRNIRLQHSIPEFSDVPPERIVSLPSLKELRIIARLPHSILLDRLSIPSGASVVLEFTFSGAHSPIPTYLPTALDNLHNLSHITTVNLCFGSEQRAMQLNGPSGELHVLGKWIREDAGSTTGTARLLRFSNRFDTSRCRWLGITHYSCNPDISTPNTTWATYQLLLPMDDLHTLTLIESNNLSFILALNPDENPNNIILCPRLEEITLYINRPDGFYVDELLSMVEERALMDAGLSAITIVSTEALTPSMEVFQLRKYVSRVEYKFDNAPPAWDTLPGCNQPERYL